MILEKRETNNVISMIMLSYCLKEASKLLCKEGKTKCKPEVSAVRKKTGVQVGQIGETAGQCMEGKEMHRGRILGICRAVPPGLSPDLCMYTVRKLPKAEKRFMEKNNQDNLGTS